MKRRKFLVIAGSNLAIAGITYYLCSDKNNFVWEDIKQTPTGKIPLMDDEREIL